jgi:crotonobetainyl-CoA:carnitine CoA-transferase CaiB-like acyl-CoA transferase
MDPRTGASAPRPDRAGGALHRLRVVELGQLIAGPFCGQMLGDHGADVLKIELPGRGDVMRQWGQVLPDDRSLWWSVLARNKRSVTLDPRTPEGRDVVCALLADADVLVENFRPGTLERWGLGYDVLSELNPGLVLVRISGFGQDGPYAGRAGFGAVGEAMGGLRHLVGEPGRPSSRAGIAIGDALAGLFGAYGALAALHDRESTGRGQVVDVAIYEAVLALMESVVPDYQVTGHLRERTGAVLPRVAPSNAYPTSDGVEVLIAANQDSVFGRLTQLMDRPWMATDPAYATHGARGERQAELDAIVSAWTVSMDAESLLSLLAAAGVPAGRIYQAPDMVRDPHYLARESITEVVDQHFGPLLMQNVFPRLSRTPGSVRWTGPELGQHNEQVLADELGLEDEHVRRLTGPTAGPAHDGLAAGNGDTP